MSAPYIRCPDPLPSQESLQLDWVFGLPRDYKSIIHNLSPQPAPVSTATSLSHRERHASGDAATATTTLAERIVFYTTAHVGVIFDALRNTQKHLIGHRYAIVGSSCSYNHRFLVTVDEGDALVRQRMARRELESYMSTKKAAGEDWEAELTWAAQEEEDAHVVDPRSARQEVRRDADGAEVAHDEVDDGSMMIVWDSATGLPLRSIPIGRYGGAVAVTMSVDGQFIATVNRRTPQEIMIWSWTSSSSSNNNENNENNNSEEEEENGELVPVFVRRIFSQDEQRTIDFSHDDSELLCTSGPQRAIFWSWREGMLKYYSPPIIRGRLRASMGHFTRTVLVPGTRMACSGTVDGELVLWALQPRDRVMKEQDKTLLKSVRVHTGGVTSLTTVGGYIVSGGMDGAVRFLDTKLRLVAWFEELNGGPILSISFDRPLQSVEQAQRVAPDDVDAHLQEMATIAATKFTAPDFMVSTANSMIIDVPAKAFHTSNGAAREGGVEVSRGKLLVQGQDQSIQCVAAHPHLSRVAVAGLSGSLHLWDYAQKRVLLLSLFRNLLVCSLCFDPKGKYLVCGFTNGVLKVLDAESLEEVQHFKLESGTNNANPVTAAEEDATEADLARVETICFSADGRLMATASANGYVGLYELTRSASKRAKEKSTVSTHFSWQLVGHHKTHKARICGLQFGSNTAGIEEAVRLLSVGEDKRLIEYDLVESNPENGLLLRTAHKITQGAVPTGFTWVPTGSQLLDAASRPRDVFESGEVSEADLHRSPSDVSGGGDRSKEASRPASAPLPTTTATSTSAAAQPRITTTAKPDPLDYLLISTNEYKMQAYMSNWSRQCVKTVLAPTYGGPVTRMLPLPPSSDLSATATTATHTMKKRSQGCVAYATREKVIGLAQLPLRGDPCASMGLLAHPGIITDMSASHDGKFIFTAGGTDHTVMQWRVQDALIMASASAAFTIPGGASALQQQQQQNNHNEEQEDAVPLDHLLSAIEGGPDGELAREIIDYFYYTQIRAQGEETTTKRELLGAIRFAQMPNLLRALGYYPSELEIGHLTYEVANTYGPHTEMLAEIDVDAILLDFATFMRLYINYRPVYGISRQDIDRAFTTLGADEISGRLARDPFFHLLSTKGEALTTAEITAALSSLLGDGVRLDMLEDYITARTFAENLLGFEDYDADGGVGGGGGGEGSEDGESGRDAEEDRRGTGSAVYNPDDGLLV